MDIREMIDEVNSKESFVKFVNALSNDSVKNKDDWESWTIEHYLESLAAWVDDHDKIESKSGEPDWHLFAYILMAASSYE